MLDKIKGGLYGVAIGDALGATVEFMGQADIQRKYGVLKDIIGGGWLNLKAGEWTDDTEMTLAVAEGIRADANNPIPHIGEAFLRWRDTNPPDIGSTILTTFRVIDNYGKRLDADDWLSGSMEANQLLGGRTAGNGALMRTLPVAFAYQGEELFENAMAIAAMTHFDSEAGLTCAAYCLALREYMNGYFKVKGLNRAWENLQHYAKREAEALQVQVKVVNMIESRISKPTGYTVDSLACPVNAFMDGDDFDEVIIQAVNLGGDADTIGAIAGGLAGVYYGYNNIPKRHIKKLSPAQKKRLDEAAAWLAERNNAITKGDNNV
ncbi:MAG: ADP-ribosyl-(dinitrogen reductase) glycohydrolase [Pelotomaculum sp. PtaU1.Bin065]|nr:MAG: ADP-ribosyl-(dinitrogen reductase) glycohydrolase [Pelotomaculum sp. PtaU1.Bin065]